MIMASNNHLRQIVFMNIKHQFPAKVQARFLTESTLWGVAADSDYKSDNDMENIIPSEDDFLYVDDHSDNDSV